MGFIETKKFKFKWLLLSLGIVVAFCVGIIALKKNAIPDWVKWQERDYGTVRVSDRKLTVLDANGSEVYSTDKTQKVQDAILIDVDGDGKEEIAAVVWKKGKFGKHRPFWIKENDEEISQHLFIYRIKDKETVEPMWFSSETGIKINRLKAMEKNKNILLLEDIDGNCTLWRWDSWGFQKLDSEVRFVAFGDNIIHSPIYEYASAKENGNFDFLYEPFKNEIESADIAALNLESVLVDKNSDVSGYPSFGAPLAVGEAIVNAGFDIAVCANNHILDKGINGIHVTKSFFENYDVLTPGIQTMYDSVYRPYELISRNGIKFAIFSYTYGTNPGEISPEYPLEVHYLPRVDRQEKELKDDLKRAREEADFLVVFVHWGNEYETEISEQQRKFAALFAEGGADLVIGTHPHVVQEVSEVDRPDGGKMLVYYSLGNFRADQAMREETKKGAEAIVTVDYKFDKVAIKSHEIKEISSYWKNQNN